MEISWAGFLVFIGLVFVGLQLEVVAKAIRNITVNVNMGTVKVKVEE